MSDRPVVLADLDQDSLPPTVSVKVAARWLGVSSWAFYEAVRRGQPPVAVLSIGRRLVVPTRPLLQALGLSQDGKP